MTADQPDARQLAARAGLLADRTRAGICLALLDGRAWTVTELASRVSVATSTASEQITRLVDGGVLAEVRQGRSRYVRLADPGVAQFIEDFSVSCGAAPPASRSLRAVSAASALAKARTCYDHLAGRLGVQLTDAMTSAGLIDQSAGFALTPTGLRWLADTMDIDVAALSAARRPLVRYCIDWTERRPHLGGAAGAALCAQFFARSWIRRPGTTRAVVVTRLGAEALATLDVLHLTNVA